jgi:hypothetical protein
VIKPTLNRPAEVSAEFQFGRGVSWLAGASHA